MQIISTTKFQHISVKKAKFLADSIKKLAPQDALDRLALTSGKSARLFSKLIKTAISNAVNNSKLDKSSLVFKSISVNKGPILKRWQPVARGMAHSIKKRTSHINIILEEKQAKSLPLKKTEEFAKDTNLEVKQNKKNSKSK